MLQEIQGDSGGETPFRKDESQSGTKTGNGTIDITMAEDGFFIATIQVNYNSSGSANVKINGTQIFYENHKNTYPFFRKASKGDSIVLTQNTSGTSHYAIYYGDSSFLDF